MQDFPRRAGVWRLRSTVPTTPEHQNPILPSTPRSRNCKASNPATPYRPLSPKSEKASTFAILESKVPCKGAQPNDSDCNAAGGSASSVEASSAGSRSRRFSVVGLWGLSLRVERRTAQIFPEPSISTAEGAIQGRHSAEAPKRRQGCQLLGFGGVKLARLKVKRC